VTQDASGGFGFPKGRRLRRRREFLEVQGGRSREAGRGGEPPSGRAGQRRRVGRFVLFLRRRPDGERGRLGITAPARVGGAVVRNRIRRLIREAWRTNDGLFPRDHDIVVLVTSGQGNWTLQVVLEELAGWKRPRSHAGTPSSTTAR
jgi:ribonuclease P protein component